MYKIPHGWGGGSISSSWSIQFAIIIDKKVILENQHEKAFYPVSILAQNNVMKKSIRSSLGGLEPPTFRLTAERANRLRHRDGIFDN